jgi:hypothetical protein
MKRRSSHHRARTFDARLLKPSSEDDSSNSFGFPSRRRQLGAGARRIFIIRQATQLPPTNSAEGKNAQHILIFDDHPESLRLVFGSRANPSLDSSPPVHVSSWAFVIAGIVTIGALVGMFWPLF